MECHANQFDNANVTGEDVEHDPKLWEATMELHHLKGAHLAWLIKLVQLITEEASKHLKSDSGSQEFYN